MKRGTDMVRTVMEILLKSWNFKMLISRPGKVVENNYITKVLSKSWKCCYIHMFIYTEFEIINMFLKERRSNYKPAYSWHNFVFCKKFRGHSNSSSGIIHCQVYTKSSQNVWWWKFGLKSWKFIGQHVYEPWTDINQYAAFMVSPLPNEPM